MFLGTKSQMSGDFFNFYNQNFAGLKTAFIYDDKKKMVILMLQNHYLENFKNMVKVIY